MDERMVVQGRQRVLVDESWLVIALPIRRLHAGGGIWYVILCCDSEISFYYGYRSSHYTSTFSLLLLYWQAIPIAALVIYIFCLLIWTGKTNPDATGEETMSEIFAMADAYTALMWGVSRNNDFCILSTLPPQSKASYF